MLVVVCIEYCLDRRERGLPKLTNGSGSGAAGVGMSAPARVAGTAFWGLKMATGLVWRTVLFFGLTAGYVLLAALPYLA